MRNIMNEQLLITESNPIKARWYDYDHFFYPWHFHSQYEMMYVNESFGQCFVGDSIVNFEAGDLILFGSNLPHYMSSDESFKNGTAKGRVRGTIIQFEENFMDYSFRHYPQFLAIKQLLEQSKRGVLFPHQEGNIIGKTMQAFPEYKGIRQITELLALLHEMACSPTQRLMASPQYYKQFPSFGDKRIDNIVSYINNNYTRKITLDEMAEKASMNRTAFCRYFKEKSGKTLLQYIMDVRIGYACKLLTMGELNVSQIALECGFESLAHFNRTFKQITRSTPLEYKRSMKG